MKSTSIFLFFTVAMLLSCSDKNSQYDASGVFETTEVIISAQASGELMQFDIEEGQSLKSGQRVGYIDTTQLYLKREQLIANSESVKSRHYNIDRQVASLKQQIATQKRECQRFENLAKSNAGTQKQVDDIKAQIALMERQLSAQKETLENGNKSVLSESTSLSMQVAQIDDQIKRSNISAPIDGVILSKYAQKGELAVQNRALFKIADISNMILRVYITADMLTEMKIGDQIKVYADQGKADRREYVGTVTWISDKAEFTPKTIQTRDERANLVYAVKIAVKNDGYIKKGMYGEIKIK